MTINPRSARFGRCLGPILTGRCAAKPRTGRKRWPGLIKCDLNVIVLDFAMPVINGLMAAQEIKVQPTVPIVLNTLYNSPQVELEAKRHGIRKVVEKDRLWCFSFGDTRIRGQEDPRQMHPHPL